MKKLFDYTYFFNESLIEIDLDKKTTDLEHIKRYGKLDLTKSNRLIHLLHEYDQNGSPILGEKIASLLLGAVNLNYYNKSYPFVDLIVKEPLEGITKKNEYISIKTSATQHSLSTSITDVNGFKISQLIQFIIQFLPLNIFKDKIFKLRNAIRTDAIVTVYYRFMKEFQDSDKVLYDHLFIMQLYYIFLLKMHIDNLRTPELLEIIEDTNEFYAMMFGIILGHVNTTFKTKYDNDFLLALSKIKPKINLTQKIIQQFNSLSYPNVDITSFLPDNIAKKQISYCMLYLEADIAGRGKKRGETQNVVLHLQKTSSVTVKDLLDRSIKLWMKLGYHQRSTRGSGKQNIYFKFRDIVEVFEPSKANLSNKDIEFETHLKVIINKTNIKNFTDRTEEEKDLIVKVIDEIKGLPSGDITNQVLKDINKITNLMKTQNSKKKEKFVNLFDDFMSSISNKKKKKSDLE